MADSTFNTTGGQTIDRELLIAYLNTAGASASSPTWSVLGMRTDDSSLERDNSKETSQDILGATRTTMKKPIITQTFDPAPLDSDYTASEWLWNRAIKDQDAAALCACDVLIVHQYVAGGTSGYFAERYPASAIDVTGLGGAGGGYINMPFNITYGGSRDTGSVTYTGSVPTYTSGGTSSGGGGGSTGLT